MIHVAPACPEAADDEGVGDTASQPPALAALTSEFATLTTSRSGIVGYIPGAWDMFHIGHLNALRFARARCDHLIVGVVADDELIRVKGRRPIVPQAERMEVISAIGIVDEAVEDTSTNKLRAWSQLKFHVLFKGDDWRDTAKGDRLQAEMQAVGVALQYFPYTQATSSTLRRKDLLSYE